MVVAGVAIVPAQRRRQHAARLLGLAAVALAAAVSAGSAGGSPAQTPALLTVIGNDTPTWSPDGRQIAFTSFRHGRGDIYAIGVDGRGERRLTTHPAHDDHAAWSPDGTRIAFISTRDGNPELYVMNADGSGQRRVLRSPGREYYPSWSPDGTRIAFQSDRAGGPHIYAIGADGSDELLLTGSQAGAHWNPAWSPAGPIAFSSNREGPFKIFLVEPDGTALRRLDRSTSFLSEQEPSWAPDAGRVAFVSTRDPPLGNTEIYSANPDGSDARRLTNYWGRDVSPAWSPDGEWIAFTRGPSAYRPEVWLMRADGSGARQLTSTATRLEVARILRVPVNPVAGRRFTLYALVSEPTGDPVEQGTPTCRATLGTRVLRVAVRRFSRSLVTCAWNVPANAKGQRVRVAFEVRSGRSSVSHALPLLVR